MRGAFGQAEFASERRVIELEPDIGAALRNKVRQLANPRWIEDGIACRRIENRQWHAPAALARDHPVGPRFHRAGDAIFAPGRQPAHILDRGQRFGAQVIDADEELFDRAEDDRRFRAPAIWIRVLVSLFAQEHSFFAQQCDDVGVRVENIFAGQCGQSGFVGVAAMIIDWRENRKAILLA